MPSQFTEFLKTQPKPAPYHSMTPEHQLTARTRFFDNGICLFINDAEKERLKDEYLILIRSMDVSSDNLYKVTRAVDRIAVRKFFEKNIWPYCNQLFEIPQGMGELTIRPEILDFFGY